ncbi:MAG: DUF1428 domain-containing protein [Planctomycetota bacterium]
MNRYIDGFVLPVARKQLADYQNVSQQVAEIYKEHGALDYLEFVGDDMHRAGTRPFPEMITASEDEAVVFGWVVFESRAARDDVNRIVEADPRMATLIAPLLDPSKPVFDANRMAYAGFSPLVSSTGGDIRN